MTYRGALTELETLRDEYGNDISSFGEEYDMVWEACDKADRYRWHDLRKNPNDLPNEDSNVLIKFRNIYKVAKYVNDFGDCYAWRSDIEAYHSNDVTGWREIDLFEEEA